MTFAKYHGLGNDFVIVDLRGGDPEEIQNPDRVRQICARRFGVGADGVLAVLPPTTSGAHARMRVLNADGSEAEMCGNGIRCVVKHLWEREAALRLGELVIDTGAGPLACRVTTEADHVVGVRVDMGRPRLLREEIPMAGPAAERCIANPIAVGERELALTCVSMGNPHAVAFVEETGPSLRALAETVGPELERHDWFPQRTNAEFARVAGPSEIELVVWERGCGITLACGTGACATAVAGVLEGRVGAGAPTTVKLLGGDLTIEVPEDLGTVFMTGPAELAFEGEL